MLLQSAGGGMGQKASVVSREAGTGSVQSFVLGCWPGPSHQE